MTALRRLRAVRSRSEGPRSCRARPHVGRGLARCPFLVKTIAASLLSRITAWRRKHDGRRMVRIWKRDSLPFDDRAVQGAQRAQIRQFQAARPRLLRRSDPFSRTGCASERHRDLSIFRRRRTARRIPWRTAEPDQRAGYPVPDRPWRLCPDLSRRPAHAAHDPLEHRLSHQYRDLLPAADPSPFAGLIADPTRQFVTWDIFKDKSRARL